MSEKTIQQLPAQTPRVETGPVQFGDDWPGVFIRGDDACHWRLLLRRILNLNEGQFDYIDKSNMEFIIGILKSCDMNLRKTPEKPVQE